MYIYESHLGGFYTSDTILDDLYCDQCGDSDYLLGGVNTKEEINSILNDSMRELYGDEYVDSVIKKLVNELEHQ